MGPVEKLVLEAWGIGIRIDTDTPQQQASLVDLLTRARAIDTQPRRENGAMVNTEDVTIEEEQSRWQERIVQAILKAGLVPFDASGNESGDPLDFTDDQVVTALRDADDRAEERTAKRMIKWLTELEPDGLIDGKTVLERLERGDWRTE